MIKNLPEKHICITCGENMYERKATSSSKVVKFLDSSLGYGNIVGAIYENALNKLKSQ